MRTIQVNLNNPSIRLLHYAKRFSNQCKVSYVSNKHLSNEIIPLSPNELLIIKKEIARHTKSLYERLTDQNTFQVKIDVKSQKHMQVLKISIKYPDSVVQKTEIHIQHVSRFNILECSRFDADTSKLYRTHTTLIDVNRNDPNYNLVYGIEQCFVAIEKFLKEYNYLK